MAQPSKPFKPSPNQPVQSDVRNSPIPRPAAAPAPARQGAPSPAKKQPTRDEIARRAYEISQSGKGGSEFDNWIRAERELRGS